MNNLKNALKKIYNIKIKGYPVGPTIFGLLFIMGFISFFVMIELGMDFRLIPYPFGIILLIYCVCFGLFFLGTVSYFMFFWKPKKL